MLAQNFLPAEALGLLDIEYNAFCRVLSMLERGELQHVPSGEWNGNNGFCMGYWFEGPEDEIFSSVNCGTVGCIAGWAEAVAGAGPIFADMQWGQPAPHRTNHDALEELFCPSRCGNRDEITTEQAAQALRSYLTHGEPRWEEALL